MAAESDATLVVFDNAKLLPHVEFPERFCEVLDERLPSTAVDPRAT